MRHAWTATGSYALECLYGLACVAALVTAESCNFVADIGQCVALPCDATKMTAWKTCVNSSTSSGNCPSGCTAATYANGHAAPAPLCGTKAAIVTVDEVARVQRCIVTVGRVTDAPDATPDCLVTYAYFMDATCDGCSEEEALTEERTESYCSAVGKAACNGTAAPCAPKEQAAPEAAATQIAANPLAAAEEQSGPSIGNTKAMNANAATEDDLQPAPVVCAESEFKVATIERLDSGIDSSSFPWGVFIAACVTMGAVGSACTIVFINCWAACRRFRERRARILEAKDDSGSGQNPSACSLCPQQLWSSVHLPAQRWLPWKPEEPEEGREGQNPFTVAPMLQGDIGERCVVRSRIEVSPFSMSPVAGAPEQSYQTHERWSPADDAVRAVFVKHPSGYSVMQPSSGDYPLLHSPTASLSRRRPAAGASSTNNPQSYRNNSSVGLSGLTGSAKPHPAGLPPLEDLEFALDELHASGQLFLGQYRLLSSLDRRRGGEGIVQFAQAARFRGEFAIKFYLEHSAFLHERSLYTRRDLETVMPAPAAIVNNEEAGFVSASGYVFPPCIVLERGESLNEWALRERRERRDFPTALHVLTHVAKRLLMLHNEGLVHRDIKPGNIVWLHQAHAWTLIDFGCTQPIGKSARIMYSLRYAAPEVIAATEAGQREIIADPAVDIWALGVIAYEFLTDTRLFGQTNQNDLYAQLAGREPLPWESMEAHAMAKANATAAVAHERGSNKKPCSHALEGGQERGSPTSESVCIVVEDGGAVGQGASDSCVPHIPDVAETGQRQRVVANRERPEGGGAAEACALEESTLSVGSVTLPICDLEGDDDHHHSEEQRRAACKHTDAMERMRGLGRSVMSCLSRHPMQRPTAAQLVAEWDALFDRTRHSRSSTSRKGSAGDA